MQPAAEEHHVASITHAQLQAVTACAALGQLLEFVASRCTGDAGQAQVDAWIAHRCPRARLEGDVRRRMEGIGKFTVVDPSPPPDMAVYS